VRDGELVETGGSVQSGFTLCKPGQSEFSLWFPNPKDFNVVFSPNGGTNQSIAVTNGPLSPISISGDLAMSKVASLSVTSTSISLQSDGDAGFSAKFTLPNGSTVKVEAGGPVASLKLSFVDGELVVETNGAGTTPITLSLSKNGFATTYQLPAGDSTKSTTMLDANGYNGTPPNVTTVSGNQTTITKPNTCATGRKDGDETDADCGGATCRKCATQSACIANRDCFSGFCVAGTCTYACSNGIQDGDESDVDCGSADAFCSTCDDGQSCVNEEDCSYNSDCVNQRCMAKTFRIDTTFDVTGSLANAGTGYIAIVATDANNVETGRGRADFSTVYNGIQYINRVTVVNPIVVPQNYRLEVTQNPSGFACRISQGATGSMPAAQLIRTITGVTLECRPAATICNNGVLDSGEAAIDCGGIACTPAGKYCPVGSACATSTDCNVGAGRSCDAGTCTQNWPVGGQYDIAIPRAQKVYVDLIPNFATASTTSLRKQLNPLARDVQTGAWSFPTTNVKSAYQVVVTTPSGVDCTIQNGSGTASAAVTNVSIKCTSCANGTMDGRETSIDCGGADCNKCRAGLLCNSGADCVSNVCTGGVCQPTCVDGQRNGTETDIDCGGATCVTQGRTCAGGAACMAGTDCASGTCTNNVCTVTATCTDGIRNGTETGIDCGGAVCVAQGRRCANGLGCAAGTDCTSTFCDATNVCATAPSCTDAVRNGNETDIDCGGATCVAQGRTCALTKACVANTDCASAVCFNNVCSVEPCTDGARNNAETDIDCGGARCVGQGRLCTTGQTCAAATDCASGICSGTVCAAAPSWATVAATTFGAATDDHLDARSFGAGQDTVAIGGDLVGTYNGATWSTSQPAPGFAWRSLHTWLDMGTPNILVASTDGVAKHHNGSDWFTPTLPNGTMAGNAIHGVDNTIFVVGTNGDIGSWDGTNFTDAFAVFPPPATNELHGVFVLDMTTAWAVGAAGTIERYNGAMWMLDTTVVTSTLRGVWAASATDAWAVGDGGTILHYNGSTWTSVASGTTQALNAVWGVSANEVYFVGNGGVIRRWNGTQVVSEVSPTTKALFTVFSRGAELWAMGADNAFVKRN
jgi:hypothetical protein